MLTVNGSPDRIEHLAVGIPPDVLRAFSYPPSVNRDAGVGGRFEG